MEVFADFNVIHITSVMRNRVPSGHYDPNWG